MMSISVTCRPEPDVDWYHGDTKVEASPRFTFIHNKGVYHLVIRNIKATDAGEWRCLATNAYGKAWCSCDLKVLGMFFFLTNWMSLALFIRYHLSDTQYAM